jgi:hypothetical protein
VRFFGLAYGKEVPLSCVFGMTHDKDTSLLCVLHLTHSKHASPRVDDPSGPTPRHQPNKFSTQVAT